MAPIMAARTTCQGVVEHQQQKTCPVKAPAALGAAGSEEKCPASWRFGPRRPSLGRQLPMTPPISLGRIQTVLCCSHERTATWRYHAPRLGAPVRLAARRHPFAVSRDTDLHMSPETQRSTPQASHLSFLDGLRALAALQVVLGHATLHVDWGADP